MNQHVSEQQREREENELREKLELILTRGPASSPLSVSIFRKQTTFWIINDSKRGRRKNRLRTLWSSATRHKLRLVKISDMNTNHLTNAISGIAKGRNNYVNSSDAVAVALADELSIRLRDLIAKDDFFYESKE